jgi:uncharacterized peroxidase-related enzyme
MAYIKIIEPEEADEKLSSIYQDILKKRGKIAEIHKIQSLHPDSIMKHMDLYMCIMYGSSPLKRYQREMMGVIVSMKNHCSYCCEHHLAALNHFWKNEERCRIFTQDYQQAALSNADVSLCSYAEKLTQEPRSDPEIIERLKQAGFSERAILDSCLVVAYFNFVNRIVLSMGLSIENNPGAYKYD